MKKNIMRFINFLMLCCLVFSLTGCDQKNQNNQLREKVENEIEYLDSAIISILNNMNNIQLENYQFKTEKISSSSQQNTNESGNETSQSSESESQKNELAYQMKPSNILINDQSTNWNDIKIEVERLYSSWYSTVIDLYKTDIDQNNISNFSKELDVIVGYIEKEDKNNTLASLGRIYQLLPNFMEKVSNDTTKTQILKTKANIENAYILIEQEKWDEIINHMNKAEETYTYVVNNVDPDNQYHINKTYILIKEFQNSIDKQNKNLLYIKYKNLIEELSHI